MDDEHPEAYQNASQDAISRLGSGPPLFVSLGLQPCGGSPFSSLWIAFTVCLGARAPYTPPARAELFPTTTHTLLQLAASLLPFVIVLALWPCRRCELFLGDTDDNGSLCVYSYDNEVPAFAWVGTAGLGSTDSRFLKLGRCTDFQSKRKGGRRLAEGVAEQREEHTTRPLVQFM